MRRHGVARTCHVAPAPVRCDCTARSARESDARIGMPRNPRAGGLFAFLTSAKKASLFIYPVNVYRLGTEAPDRGRDLI
ncbi:hypothetical protein [Ancylobacter sp.]|uniref:hypothetical protein n=1 Tax=Ancylobacter sp. TaxID=1872567 RepID=UPI003BA8AAB7